MEQYDPALARRVWERVQQRQEETGPSPALAPLHMEAAADAAVCRQMAAVSGRKAGLLRRAAENLRETSECLRGILRLQGESAAAASGQRSHGEAALRRCLGHCLGRAAALTQWAGHREYGAVFAALAETEAETARLLLRVLGTE